MSNSVLERALAIAAREKTTNQRDRLAQIRKWCEAAEAELKTIRYGKAEINER